MKNRKLCQSCSMPLEDHAMCGTEKDGSMNKEYCKYCYRNGAFVDPFLTLDGMKLVVKGEMGKRNINTGIIEKAIGVLPYLKRWAV